MADAPMFAQQTLTLVWTLMDLANVSADRIVVHALDGSDTRLRQQLDSLGVETKRCRPFRLGHPHCNKLQQLEDEHLQAAEVAILCDTDLAFTEHIDDMLSATAVRAKVVDLPNPPLEDWRRILAAAGMPPDAALGRTSFGECDTLAVNCNGGLYMLPGWALRLLAEAWPRWATWLIERPDLLPERFRVHIDQIAFGLAMLEQALPIDPLPLDCNFPTHAAVGPKPNMTPRVIHYHDHVDASGFLQPVGQPRVDLVLASVNAVIRRRRRARFDNQTFWDFRYSRSPDLGSGVGSRGRYLDEKRRLLAAVVRPTDTVLDIGCGDLEISRLLDLSAYTGVDVSAAALVIARAKRPEWSFLRGEIHELALDEHDVVLSFDVLIHQRSEAAYRSIVAQLLLFARRCLVVSGYNQTPWHQSEMTFFHEALTSSLARLVGSAALEIVGGYRDTTVVRVDTASVDDRNSVLGQLRRSRAYDTLHGHFVSLDGDPISSQFESFGAHTRNDLAMILSLLVKGDVVIDVGAHIGSFAVPMAGRVGPTGTVVAVEPDPTNIELLFQNIVRNDVADRIVVVPAVISSKPGAFRAVHDPDNAGAVHFAPDPAGEHFSVSVDQIVAARPEIGRVRLLKVDVEGMEVAVLESARATIEAARPLIYCEVVEAHLARLDASIDDLARLFVEHRYATYRNRGDRYSTYDRFDIVRLDHLREGGSFFDCLAVPAEEVEHLTRYGQLPPGSPQRGR
jgi:FkbM family methyltransferase